MPVGYKNMAGPNPRSNNVGGLTGRIFVAPLDYFTTLQKVLDLSDLAATSETDFVTITADHVFAASKGFHKIYCTRDMGKVTMKAVGERDGRGYKIEGEIMHPGFSPEIMAWGTMGKNDRMIVLAELADGQLLQAGSEQFPCEMKFDFDAAGNESGLRGTKITFSAFSAQPQIYQGEVVISTT